jgi:hypothetical protein
VDDLKKAFPSAGEPIVTTAEAAAAGS